MLAVYVELFMAVLVWGALFGCSLPRDPSSSCPYPNRKDGEVVGSVSNEAELADQQDCGNKIWSGISDRNEIVWKRNDIFLKNGNRKEALFLPAFSNLHRTEARRAKSSVNSDRTLLDSEFLNSKTELWLRSSADIAIKSFMGPFVTFEIEYASVLEGSPGMHKTWWLTLDLSKKQKIEPFSVADDDLEAPGNADLRGIFPESDLLNAILENDKIQKSLKNQNRNGQPGSLIDLLENENKYKENPRLKAGTDSHFLTPYSFEHFVLDRIENNKIVVLLATVNFAAANTYENEYIEIALPIPSTYIDEFSVEPGRQQRAFLRQDMEKLAKGCSTALDMKTSIRILPDRRRKQASNQ